MDIFRAMSEDSIETRGASRSKYRTTCMRCGSTVSPLDIYPWAILHANIGPDAPRKERHDLRDSPELRRIATSSRELMERKLREDYVELTIVESLCDACVARENREKHHHRVRMVEHGLLSFGRSFIARVEMPERTDYRVMIMLSVYYKLLAKKGIIRKDWRSLTKTVAVGGIHIVLSRASVEASIERLEVGRISNSDMIYLQGMRDFLESRSVLELFCASMCEFDDSAELWREIEDEVAHNYWANILHYIFNVDEQSMLIVSIAP